MGTLDLDSVRIRDLHRTWTSDRVNSTFEKANCQNHERGCGDAYRLSLKR
jgi:hypothetical protein